VPPQPSIDVFRTSESGPAYIERINVRNPSLRYLDLFSLECPNHIKFLFGLQQITFRFYRPDFTPSPSLLPHGKTHIGTPICKCNVPCILRPDARGKAAAALASSTSTDDHDNRKKMYDNNEEAEKAKEDQQKLMFFWSCNAGTQNEGKSCGMFKFLDMKAERRGPCIVY
jgi:hypothetical protein